ncbi:sodium-coupled neutral amino acid transporter 5 [Tachysurus fulvidraco]|uniref:sodium-coupled neutral amino acid transporter 5 n=1 Tax=Tachysurus fulvidraco TaxID=1234273 RepID=UPI000F50F9A5|nr:sodium-coupled neutral amino acid transporter 5 [Tachysurus fulvidraco]XP_047679000.1 sodium-coupled neutral amino acid transporter 5 [Tachysurus fulvidraco]
MELDKMVNGHCEKRGEEDGFDALENMPEREELLDKNTDEKKEEKKGEFTDFVGKTSFGMSIFNLSNAIMGSGILGLAYAMSNTGIILFVILIILIAILSAYSIHLLLKCAGVVGIRAYEQLGFRAFGSVGKIIAACVITIHNIGAMSSYLFIVKTELPAVIIGLVDKQTNSEWYVNGSYLIIIVSICIILPLALMRHLGYLGYTSGFSLTCMFFFLISVIYKKFVTACSSEHPSISTNTTNMTLYTTTHNPDDYMHNSTCKAELITLTPQAAYTIPILAFAFVCHPEVLPIYTELKKPTKQRMQKVANISILSMFIMYLLTAIFGYLTFYGNVKDELLKSYSTNDTLMLCVRLAVLVAVTLTVPVVLFPIRRAVQQLFFNNKPFRWVRHIAIAVILLIFVNILVIFVPDIREIFGVIGATSAPSLIFILPGIFYIRIIPEEQEPLKSRPKIQAAIFAALGFLFMVMSMSSIIIQWVTGGSRVGGH